MADVTQKIDRLYRTQSTLERTLRVCYPADRGEIVLRTEQDWTRDVAPVSVSDDGLTSTFRVQADQPFLYFKPCLIANASDAAAQWRGRARLADPCADD